MSENGVLATWVIRSIVGYPRQSAVYIFILSNQPVILETNETPVSGVKLYQGDFARKLRSPSPEFCKTLFCFYIE